MTTTFAAAWARAVADRADATFLVFEGSDGRATEWSYAAFDREVGRAGRLLVDRGVEPGAAVHLALTNSPMFVALWLAAGRLGAWIVPSDPLGRAPELGEHITRTKPAVGFCAATRAAEYRPAAGAMPVVEIDEADTALVPLPGEPLTDWPRPAPLDRAAVLFTSGTTGRPKGVEVTDRKSVV